MIDIYLYWKEGVFIVISHKTETKISKIQHYKDKILNRNTIKKEKNIRHSDIKPGSSVHNPTTLTITLRKLSLQVEFRSNHIICIHQSVSIEQ